MSLKLLCSVEEARQRTIADAVWREIFWLMPRGRTVTIVVRGGKVSVDIGPVCTEAATDASHRGGGSMTHYTVCCGYASHYHNTVTIEADTLDEALAKAIEQAGDDPHWKSIDQASQTFVDAVAEGAGRPDRERHPARNAPPAFPEASHTRFGVPPSFPGLSRVCRPLSLHTPLLSHPTHASTPGRAGARHRRSISGAARRARQADDSAGRLRKARPQ